MIRDGEKSKVRWKATVIESSKVIYIEHKYVYLLPWTFPLNECSKEKQEMRKTDFLAKGQNFTVRKIESGERGLGANGGCGCLCQAIL
jgi:hypothetical protein